MAALRTLSVFCLLAVFSSAAAQSPYFCDTQGAVLEYERRYAETEELKWRHRMSIDSLREQDGAVSIDYSSLFTRPGGGSMYGGEVALKAQVLQNGDVEMDLALSVASVFANYVGEQLLRYEPHMSVLPADMRPGQSLEDAHFVVAVMGMKFRVSIDERVVLREERLSTPAGEFDCVVVREHKIEKGPGRNRETTALTWYSKSVGMVRHDTYDKNMKLETCELLVSMIR